MQEYRLILYKNIYKYPSFCSEVFLGLKPRRCSFKTKVSFLTDEPFICGKEDIKKLFNACFLLDYYKYKKRGEQ